MSFILQGSDGTAAEVDGTAFRALRTTVKPANHVGGGHYRIALNVTIAPSQTNGTMFSLRWTDPTKLCILNFARMEFVQTAVATATIWPVFSMIVARQFTASDSGGSTDLTAQYALRKRSLKMAPSSFNSDIRYGLGAALTAGTRALDGANILTLFAQSTAGATNQNTYKTQADFTYGESPLILSNNEGLVITGPGTSFGVAGAASLLVDVAWAEVPTY